MCMSFLVLGLVIPVNRDHFGLTPHRNYLLKNKTPAQILDNDKGLFLTLHLFRMLINDEFRFIVFYFKLTLGTLEE